MEENRKGGSDFAFAMESVSCIRFENNDGACLIEEEEQEMKKAVVSVLGLDQVGITAKVCGALAEMNINILDISQTIVGGYFNMVMVVDITAAKETFDAAAEKLHTVGTGMGLKVTIQRTEIFDAMHRI